MNCACGFEDQEIVPPAPAAAQQGLGPHSCTIWHQGFGLDFRYEPWEAPHERGLAEEQ